MTEIDITNLFAAMDIAVMLRKDDQSYQLIGKQPLWMEEFHGFIFPDTSQSRFENLSPFLESFLNGLKHFWRLESVVGLKKRKSGWWTKISEDGTIHYFQATAICLGKFNFLLVEHMTAEAEPFLSLQKYKEQILELEDLAQSQLDCIEELDHYKTLSFSDELTGLPNQTGFHALAKQKMDKTFAANRALLIISVGLDGLHLINEKFGTSEGSMALITIANILKQVFPKTDLISRFSGGEFLVLAEETPLNDETKVIDRITKAVKELNSRSAKIYLLSVSIGVSKLLPYDHDSFESQTKSANAQMNKEKTEKNFQLITRTPR